MRLQGVPFRFIVQGVYGQINDHFTEKIVGTVAHIVPQRDFEQPIVQICPPEAFVNERLAPARVVSQCQGFGSPFGLFASIGKQTNFGVRIPCGAVEPRHQIGGAYYGHDQLQRAGVEAELNLYPATNAVLLVLVVVVVLLLLLLGSSRSRSQSIWVSEVR